MTNTEKKPVAVIYVRVSTEEQKKGLSIEVQEKLCRDRAEEMKYDVLKVFDDSGISGHREDRAGIIRIKELFCLNNTILTETMGHVAISKYNRFDYFWIPLFCLYVASHKTGFKRIRKWRNSNNTSKDGRYKSTTV